MNKQGKTPRSAATYRGSRRNAARQPDKIRFFGSFVGSWAEAQASGVRRGRMPETYYAPFYAWSKRYPFSSDRQNARYARQSEGRANG